MPKFTDGNGDRKFIKGKGRRQDMDLAQYDRDSKRHDSYVDVILSKHKEDLSADDEKRKTEEQIRKQKSELAEKARRADKIAKKKVQEDKAALKKRIVARAKKDLKKCT